MANDLTSNPLVIDTAGGGVLLTIKLRVLLVEWIGADTQDDVALIKDQNGKVVYDAIAPGGRNEDVRLRDGKAVGAWNGINVVTLDSGKLYIHLR